jgi:hypothetical protein
MQLAKIENGKLELVQDTLAHVKTFKRNTKWVVIFGVGRGGKSTLGNLLTSILHFILSFFSSSHLFLFSSFFLYRRNTSI